MDRHTLCFATTLSESVGFVCRTQKRGNFLKFKSFILIHMIYYKFLNDKKGDLSQLWIAAQSPNKVSKRVILDISITVR